MHRHRHEPVCPSDALPSLNFLSLLHQRKRWRAHVLDEWNDEERREGKLTNG
jgi:hypothetical protein